MMVEDDDCLRELEARAVDLDRREAAAMKSVDEAATVSAKRRLLLLDLNAVGLFEGTRAEAMRVRLGRLDLPTLKGYHTAAMQLVRYLDSVERRRYNPGKRAQPIVGAPVSVDWFRRPDHTPQDYEPFVWLGYCEYVLGWADVAGDEGGSGELFTKIDAEMTHLVWRKDDGVTPALVSARRSR